MLIFILRLCRKCKIKKYLTFRGSTETNHKGALFDALNSDWAKTSSVTERTHIIKKPFLKIKME